MAYLLHQEQPDEPVLRLYLIGAFQLVGQGPTVLPQSLLNSRSSARTVLKLLACAPGRQATRSQIAGILWPETDEERARDSLRSAWAFLRRVLRTVHAEDVLQLRNKGDVLQLVDQSRLWIDADAFEGLVAQADRADSEETVLALGEEAYRLLRGEFLADDQSAEWTTHRLVKKRRQLLWMTRSRLTRQLSDLYVQRGQIRLAEEVLEAQLTHFPTDQDALYRLLVLLERQGSFEQATILYERARRTLEVSGKTPARHVQACYERLQRTAATRPITLFSTPGTAFRPASPQAPLSAARRSLMVPVPSAGNQQEAETPLIGAINTLSSLLSDQSFAGDGEMLRLFSALEGSPDMPQLSRRQLLQLGIAAFISRLAHLDNKRISAIEQEELAHALGQSIADGWQMFHTASNAEVLAMAQIQLSLIHQTHTLLHPSIRSSLYAGANGLLGLALHLHRCEEEALHTYRYAHLAAVATGDPLHIARNLIAQAAIYLALGRYAEAVQVLEEAYSYLGDLDEEHRRTKAHVLGCWADTAMTMRDYKAARQKIDAIAALLDQISPNAEFDRSSLCELTGKYAYLTGDYAAAIQWYEQALSELPGEWILRQMLVLMPLISTYTAIQDRDASLITVAKVAQVAPVLNAPIMNEPLIDALQGLLIVFPHETKVKTAVSDLLQQISPKTG